MYSVREQKRAAIMRKSRARGMRGKKIESSFSVILNTSDIGAQLVAESTKRWELSDYKQSRVTGVGLRYCYLNFLTKIFHCRCMGLRVSLC